MADLLEPKEMIIEDEKGRERTYILSKFPAVQGREIIAKYPVSNMPKIGDYAVSEETMLKLMKFVAVKTGEITQPLISATLVNQHVPDWEVLAKIEMAMMEYNCSFFRDGRILNALQEYAKNITPKILKMLMDLLAQSSQTGKQP